MSTTNPSREKDNFLSVFLQRLGDGIRWLPKNVVLFQDRIVVQLSVDGIKNTEYMRLRTLDGAPLSSVRLLRDGAQLAAELQAAARETTAHMKLPIKGQLTPPEDLSKQIEAISLNVQKTLLKTVKNQFDRDLKAAVKRRISPHAAEHMKHAKELLRKGHASVSSAAAHGVNASGAIVDGADIAQHASTSTSVGIATADHVSASTAISDGHTHLNALDLRIMDSLDAAGMVDGLAMLQDSLIEAFPIGAALLDTVGDFAIVPGLFSSARAVVKEINLLAKNETTFEDSFKATFLPVLAKTGLVAGAAALEVATGGMFLGAIVVGTIIVTAIVGKQHIKDQAKAQWDELHGYQQEIHTRKKTAAQAVSDAAAEHYAWLPKLLANCPSLRERQEVRIFLAGLAQAYAVEADSVSQLVEKDARKRVENLSPANWLDRALKMDRTAARRVLYQKTANEISSKLKLGAIEFRNAANTDLPSAVHSIRHRTVITDGEAARIIGLLETWLPQALLAHSREVAQWRQECIANWTVAGQRTEAVSGPQSLAVKALVDRLKPRMEPLRKSLRASMTRLGQKIDF